MYMKNVMYKIIMGCYIVAALVLVCLLYTSDAADD